MGSLAGPVTPKLRVKAAWLLLVGSVVAMLANVGLFLADVITTDDLILVTLVLSWLAITFTALDILSTSDVRKEQEER